MKSLDFRRAALGFCVAAAMLAGCGAPMIAPGGVPENNARTSGADRGRSWMLPEAKSEDLLYISDSVANEVYVYAYPAGKLVGTLKGLQQPEGECVDKKGDVFVANYGGASILEYAHGGTSAKATLADYYGYPQNCSVDSTTGNLAVTNASTVSDYPGNVVIYANASGTPTEYADYGAIYFYDYCGYDTKGNLWIDGSEFTRHSEYFVLAELPNGGSLFSLFKLNQHVATPGGVQWAGAYLAVGDADKSVIYQFAIKGHRGTKAGETSLDASGTAGQFWIQARTVVVPDIAQDTKHDRRVRFYKYPGGGEAIKTIDGFKSPDGATVSLAD